MFDIIINGSDFGKGIITMAFGMFGVFAVLILFYFTIILLNRLLPHKEEI